MRYFITIITKHDTSFILETRALRDFKTGYSGIKFQKKFEFSNIYSMWKHSKIAIQIYLKKCKESNIEKYFRTFIIWKWIYSQIKF